VAGTRIMSRVITNCGDGAASAMSAVLERAPRPTEATELPITVFYTPNAKVDFAGFVVEQVPECASHCFVAPPRVVVHPLDNRTISLLTMHSLTLFTLIFFLFFTASSLCLFHRQRRQGDGLIYPEETVVADLVLSGKRATPSDLKASLASVAEEIQK